jgi:hypothetical protein
VGQQLNEAPQMRKSAFINPIDLSAVDGGPEWGVKDSCLVSKLLNAKITLDATLASCERRRPAGLAGSLIVGSLKPVS